MSKPERDPMVLPNDFGLRLTMSGDWHIGSGTGRPGDVDRLVLRDDQELPFVPGKTLTGIWREACEVVALGLDQGVAGKWCELVVALFGDEPSIASPPRAGKAEPLRPPRKARLSIRPLRLPMRLRSVLRNSPLLRDALTFVKPGVRIDPASGRAMDKHLRFIEMVRGGTVLEGSCSLDLAEHGEMRHDATALLLAGSLMVDRLGGQRRRGAGRCRLEVLDRPPKADAERMAAKPAPDAPADQAPEPATIDNAKLTWAIEHLSARQEPELPPDVANAHAPAATIPVHAEGGLSPGQPPPESDAAWFRIPLELEAVTPLLLGARTVGNLIQTMDFVPGSSLLPIVTRAWEGLGMDVRGAVRDGELVCTNGTIEISGDAGRPIPLALARRKVSEGFDEMGAVFNRMVEASPTGRGGQVKPYRAGYVGAFDGACLPEYRVPRSVSTTHNTIDNLRQRPTEEIGGLYTYQAMVAGTRFRSEIRVSSRSYALLTKISPSWWAGLAGPHRVGRSKKDDYGQVDVTVGDPEPIVIRGSDPERAPASRIREALRTNNGRVAVWLLSDTLVRDRHLRPAASIDAVVEAIAAALRPDGEPGSGTAAVASRQEDSPYRLRIAKTNDEALLMRVGRVSRRESWHAGWGLPRPTLVGLQAGSCFVLEAEGLDDAALDTLVRLEITGLGERCAEGFGQIRFADPMLSTALNVLPRSRPEELSAAAEEPMICKQDPSWAYARLLERQAWISSIDAAALRIAYDREMRYDVLRLRIEKGESKPQRSQLGGLRTALSWLDLGPEEGRSMARAWLDGLKGKPNRSDRWPPGSLDRIQTLLSEDGRVWETVIRVWSGTWGGGDAVSGRSSAPVPGGTSRQLPAVTEGAETELRSELWGKALRAVVLSCLQAHRRDLEAATAVRSVSADLTREEASDVRR